MWKVQVVVTSYIRNYILSKIKTICILCADEKFIPRIFQLARCFACFFSACIILTIEYLLFSFYISTSVRIIKTLHVILFYN